MYTEKVTQTFKRYLSFVTFGKKHSHSKIYHHWENVLIVFFALNSLLLGFSLYLFFQINEEGIFLVKQNQEVQVNTIDRKALQELLASFEIKEILFEDRTISAPKLPDPSL